MIIIVNNEGVNKTIPDIGQNLLANDQIEFANNLVNKNILTASEDLKNLIITDPNVYIELDGVQLSQKEALDFLYLSETKLVDQASGNRPYVVVSDLGENYNLIFRSRDYSDPENVLEFDSAGAGWTINGSFKTKAIEFHLDKKHRLKGGRLSIGLNTNNDFVQVAFFTVHEIAGDLFKFADITLNGLTDALPFESIRASQIFDTDVFYRVEVTIPTTAVAKLSGILGIYVENPPA